MRRRRYGMRRHAEVAPATQVKMTPLRQRVAQRLKDAQNTAASLTTFNEIDMNALKEIRSKHAEAFQAKHGVKLGFMSAFVRAAVVAIKDQPVMNASTDRRRPRSRASPRRQRGRH